MFLKDKLSRFNILAYDIFKQSGAQWAILTVAREANGSLFIKHYQFQEKLVLKGRILRCKKSNRKGQPEALKVVSLLEKEENMRLKSTKPSLPKAQLAQPHFAFLGMMTGVWDYDRLGSLIFDQKYQDHRRGTIIFGRTALVVYLECQKNAQTEIDCNCRIDIPYSILEHTVPSGERGGRGSLLLTLKSPPKMYRIESNDSLHLYTGTEPSIESQLAAFGMISLNFPEPSKQSRPLYRLCTLQRRYDKSAALCMVYKLEFASMQTVRHAWTFIKDFAVSGVDPWKTIIPYQRTDPIERDYKMLEATLTDVTGIHISFAVAFQLMALVLEGTVSPANMLELIPGVCDLAQRHGSEETAVGVGKLAQQIPTPVPNVNGDKFRPKGIIDLLEVNIDDSLAGTGSSSNVFKRKKQQHLALTYKATVTPTGLVLRGPEWGVSNRVLRKYSKHTECFMRVFFADEDGLSVFHDPQSSQDDVYARFKEVLRNGITIAGRTFEFLGFSHASLRYHAVWFMSPFYQDGVQIQARHVISDLGDFSNIHCSAKCAARIG
jgi:hypothetical protein